MRIESCLAQNKQLLRLTLKCERRKMQRKLLSKQRCSVDVAVGANLRISQGKDNDASMSHFCGSIFLFQS